jgi:UDP:flavonoid glycosyltransferase YjiC (YdhE family)
MCALLTHGSRGDVEPLVRLAVQVRTFGAEVRCVRLRTPRNCWGVSACR